MRVNFRIFLLVVLTLGILTPTAFADHFTADCPLALVGDDPAAPPAFFQSPRGIFKNGSVVYLLSGGRITTLNVTDLGDVQVGRDDNVTALSGRENDGGVAYSNGFLFISTEAGLEIFDLRNTRGGPGGVAPALVSRTPGLHYRQLAVSGNLLVGVYPAYDLPCAPLGTTDCRNSIDIFNVADLGAPSLITRIQSNLPFRGFNDVEFANGFLYATGLGGTFAFSLIDPARPLLVFGMNNPGTFLVAGGGNSLVGVGQEGQIAVYTTNPGGNLTLFSVFTLPAIVDRSNPLMFHPEAWFDTTRLIAMVDEKDPLTGRPARTIAFDVFDFTVPLYEGSADRIYENVSYTLVDEIKYSPIAAGPYVYVIGEVSGAQIYGVCGQIAGQIHFDGVNSLACGGAELRGTVTGQQKIRSVEVYLDGNLLGTATLGHEQLTSGSRTPVVNWRLSVNLDQTPAGAHTIRAIATDTNGNRRQFSSLPVNFPGPGGNCTTRRRGLKR